MTAQRVLLVDDHELVRSAVKRAVQARTGFEVVGEAADAGGALELALQVRPDILLMDIDMPGMICFDAVCRMLTQLPDLRVIFLSAYFHDRYIDQALRVGARGYVVKGDALAALFEALDRVAEGGTFFSPQVRARICGERAEAPQVNETPVTRAATLTQRELEVLSYLARGLSKKEVGKIMHLSVKTVEHHSSSVMRKLDIHDRVELARYAIREGLVQA